MFDIERYLKMSPYNPEFIKDFSYNLLQLELMRSKGEITDSECRDYIDKLQAVKNGTDVDSLSPTFVRYETIRTKGYYNLNLSREEVEGILKARVTIVEFTNHVQLGNHRPGNRAILAYLAKQAQKVLDLLRAPAEELWSELHVLQRDTTLAVARGLVSRVDMPQIAKILKVGMVQRLKVERALPDRRGYMEAFNKEAPVAKLDFDIDAVGVNLIEQFLTDGYAFKDSAKAIEDSLLSAFNEGKITQADYSHYNRIFLSYAYPSVSVKDLRVFQPISDFYWNKINNIGQESLLVYPEEQMIKALDFGRSFYSLFRSSFLIEEMLIRKLKIDLSKYDNSLEVRKQLYDAYTNILEVFKDFGIVDTTQYLDYRQKGREKFL